ncbi:MAG: hypothetical protein PHV32_15475 [Eubacteriales bacterium]|nr:hypothetical protein [Eubacteriales bacterium]
MSRDKDDMLMCLCSVCRDQFTGIPGTYLKRVDKEQVIKETCTYCGIRKGYDYRVLHRKVRKEKRE